MSLRLSETIGPTPPTPSSRGSPAGSSCPRACRPSSLWTTELRARAPSSATPPAPRCAPQPPRLQWVRQASNKIIEDSNDSDAAKKPKKLKIIARENPQEAAAYEQALKRRPAPFVVQWRKEEVGKGKKESDKETVGDLVIAVNPATLVHRGARQHHRRHLARALRRARRQVRSGLRVAGGQARGERRRRGSLRLCAHLQPPRPAGGAAPGLVHQVPPCAPSSSARSAG